MYTYDILENNTVKIRPITSKDIEENYFDNLEVLKKQLTDEKFTIVSDIAFAKFTLRNEGYFVDNLWHVNDVQENFECDDETAQNILYWALTSPNVIEYINDQINLVATNENLKRK